MNDKMLTFEEDVLNMLLHGDDVVLDTLRSQLQLVSSRRREMTGVGFFTYFDVAESAPRLAGSPSFGFGDVGAEIHGLEFGADFVLFIDNGVLAMLEGVTYQEPWPPTISDYKLTYSTKGPRDLAALRLTPGWPNELYRRKKEKKSGHPIERESQSHQDDRPGQ